MILEVEAELRAVGADVLDFRSLPLEGKKKQVNTSDMLRQRDDALSYISVSQLQCFPERSETL